MGAFWLIVNTNLNETLGSADTPIMLFPTLRVVMHFVTLCVTSQPWGAIQSGPRYR
ncbi:hypothetical protein PSE10B_29950 [Pseudomonas amygdali pv. eriobotryae]|uniref:Uncharacterized protein n=1 Tax=Pseudomonas amygdali pv. eriobotryae TaxID=129137 RepID=A0A9P3AAF4_PSEA0|nr:hypothetical protein PSE10A_14700 [Pseudomonas amygdali pv. eriobotryae]GFZ66473.1 hypothetical protein PSE10B_29950 [Pseudomonas amygdali pv. eriobotryae]GFZ70377.1 hypothetical protein PSE10C_11190 [Pseudomonas amygdali pv. eriobotryae]